MLVLLIIYGAMLVALPFFVARLLVIILAIRIVPFITITVAIVCLVFLPAFMSQSLLDRSKHEEAYWLHDDYDWKSGAALTRHNAYLFGLPWTFLAEIWTIGPYPYSDFERFEDIKRYHRSSWTFRWIFMGVYVTFTAYYLGRRFYLRRVNSETYSEHVEPAAPWETHPEIPFGALHWRMGPGVNELNEWCADIRELDDTNIDTYILCHPPPCGEWKGWSETTITSIRAERTRLRTNR